MMSAGPGNRWYLSTLNSTGRCLGLGRWSHGPRVLSGLRYYSVSKVLSLDSVPISISFGRGEGEQPNGDGDPGGDEEAEEVDHCRVNTCALFAITPSISHE